MDEERRRLERLNLLTDISFTKRGQKEKTSQTKNISAGGICIISYDPLQESDILDLKIKLPDNENPIDIVGRVAWVKEFSIGDSKGKKFDVGIEFVEVKDKDRERINTYIFSHI